MPRDRGRKHTRHLEEKISYILLHPFGAFGLMGSKVERIFLFLEQKIISRPNWVMPLPSAAHAIRGFLAQVPLQTLSNRHVDIRICK